MVWRFVNACLIGGVLLCPFLNGCVSAPMEKPEAPRFNSVAPLPAAEEPQANPGHPVIQRTAHEVLVDDDGYQQTASIDLDLADALSMVDGQSPRIAYASARYREAYARLAAAKVLWLPSIRAGVSFNHHDGPLQETGGNVLDVSRSSLQSGLGSRAVGAGSPAVPGVIAEFHTSDVIYQPKIAAHAASARSAASRRATNDTLLATSLAYLELLRSVQQLRIAEETQSHAQDLANLTKSFASSGQGPQADADRAQVELVRRRNDVSRSQEATRIASARLAEILSLDPTLKFVPRESTVVPIDLVSVPDDSALASLVATGLASRPELAESQALVCEAVHRYRREKHAPLIPSVLLGVSQSGFGGGTGSHIDDFGGRFDFDAAVYWEVRNLGLGEKARRDEASAQYAQRRAIKAQMMDRVAREVVEAGTQVNSRQAQIAIAESGIRAATDSYHRNLARIREGQGLPIEALQAIQALDDARREYLRTVVDYNEAQFRLQRALGWPIQ
jgi:outer membrane protein TolC